MASPTAASPARTTLRRTSQPESPDPFGAVTGAESFEIAVAAFEQGNWQKAESQMQAAVQALEAESQFSEQLGTALCELSRILCDNRKWPEARQAAERALSVAEVIGFDSEVAMCGLSRRLVVAAQLNERPELEDLMQRAAGWLGSAREGGDDNVAGRALLLATLANCHRHVGRQEEAVALDDQYEQLCKVIKPRWSCA